MLLQHTKVRYYEKGDDNGCLMDFNFRKGITVKRLKWLIAQRIGCSMDEIKVKDGDERIDISEVNNLGLMISHCHPDDGEGELQAFLVPRAHHCEGYTNGVRCNRTSQDTGDGMKSHQCGQTRHFYCCHDCAGSVCGSICTTNSSRPALVEPPGNDVEDYAKELSEFLRFGRADWHCWFKLESVRAQVRWPCSQNNFLNLVGDIVRTSEDHHGRRFELSPERQGTPLITDWVRASYDYYLKQKPTRIKINHRQLDLEARQEPRDSTAAWFIVKIPYDGLEQPIHEGCHFSRGYLAVDAGDRVFVSGSGSYAPGSAHNRFENYIYAQNHHHGKSGWLPAGALVEERTEYIVKSPYDGQEFLQRGDQQQPEQGYLAVKENDIIIAFNTSTCMGEPHNRFLCYIFGKSQESGLSGWLPKHVFDTVDLGAR